MIVFRLTDDRASNCYQETVKKDIFLLFLNPSNVKVLENLKTIVSLLKITEERVLLLYLISKLLDFQVFSDNPCPSKGLPVDE